MICEDGNGMGTVPKEGNWAIAQTVGERSCAMKGTPRETKVGKGRFNGRNGRILSVCPARARRTKTDCPDRQHSQELKLDNGSANFYRVLIALFAFSFVFLTCIPAFSTQLREVKDTLRYNPMGSKEFRDDFEFSLQSSCYERSRVL